MFLHSAALGVTIARYETNIYIIIDVASKVIRIVNCLSLVVVLAILPLIQNSLQQIPYLCRFKSNLKFFKFIQNYQ